jgi:hypothetical protein
MAPGVMAPGVMAPGIIVAPAAGATVLAGADSEALVHVHVMGLLSSVYIDTLLRRKKRTTIAIAMQQK